uniref:Aromatic amino acid lyase n=1 Tax=Thermorudis peleae TaxID=1382356 RepID=A0A831TD18_9BACT
MVLVGERPLSVGDVVRVARYREVVALASTAAARVCRAWELAQATARRGSTIYGLTTGVGALRDRSIADAEQAEFNRRLLRSHQVATGPSASEEIARAALLCWLSQLSTGFAPVRPLLLDRLVEALNGGPLPSLRLRGSIGASDLGPNADLAAALYAGVALEPGEGLILLNHSAPTVGLASLGVWDARRLILASELALAASLEAFRANLSPYHRSVARSRPSPSLDRTLDRLHALLAGSVLWDAGNARMLQDPLSFRSGLHLAAAAREALDRAHQVVDRWLNSYQGNPVALVDDGLVLSCSNFESADLSAALDYLRLALVPLLQSSAERVAKLLNERWSGLPTGLMARSGLPESGLSIAEIAAHALATEARLLAYPVSLEAVSGSLAEGIEDRGSFALLGARRLREMIELGWDILAIEAVTAHRALAQRGVTRVGEGVAALLAELDRVLPVDIWNYPLAELFACARAVLEAHCSDSAAEADQFARETEGIDE